MITQKRYIKGHFIGLGAATGIPIGVPLGFMIGEFVVGLAIGLVLGFLIGFILEKKLNKNPIPISDFEKSRQKTRMWAGVIGGGILLVALLAFYFLSK